MSTLRKTSEVPRSGIGLCQTYLAVRNHFAGNFDAAKYGLSCRIKPESYDKRKDKALFEKWKYRWADKLDEFPLFLASNIIKLEDRSAIHPKLFVGKPSEIAYEQHIGWFESLGYNVAKDMTPILVRCQDSNISLHAALNNPEIIADFIRKNDAAPDSQAFLMCNIISQKCLCGIDILAEHDILLKRNLDELYRYTDPFHHRFMERFGSKSSFPRELDKMLKKFGISIS